MSRGVKMFTAKVTNLSMYQGKVERSAEVVRCLKNELTLEVKIEDSTRAGTKHREVSAYYCKNSN